MFKVNNKDTNGVILVSLLLSWTYSTPCSSVSFVNFEQVNVDWGLGQKNLQNLKKKWNIKQVDQ